MQNGMRPLLAGNHLVVDSNRHATLGSKPLFLEEAFQGGIFFYFERGAIELDLHACRFLMIHVQNSGRGEAAGPGSCPAVCRQGGKDAGKLAGKKGFPSAGSVAFFARTPARDRLEEMVDRAWTVADHHGLPGLDGIEEVVFR